MRKEMERRNRGLRMGIAQFPPEFVWCCLQGQTSTSREQRSLLGSHQQGSRKETLGNVA